MSLMAIMIRISRLFFCFDRIAPSDIMKIVKTVLLFAQWERHSETDKSSPGVDKHIVFDENTRRLFL